MNSKEIEQVKNSNKEKTLKWSKPMLRELKSVNVSSGQGIPCINGYGNLNDCISMGYGNPF